MIQAPSPAFAERFFNVPLALLPARAPLLLETLKTAAEISQIVVRPQPYEVIHSIAVIPICGVLLHGEGYYWGDCTSYNAIARCLIAALADPEVKAIALYINSPGGEVAGCFDLADAIYAMRGEKPIWAILDEYAFSAAYALASAADRIVVPRTGGTGSIGVITMHVDITKMLDQFGVKVTTIQFGDRKSDSYPTTPLSDGARERLQADIDVLGEMFVALVARNRGVNAMAVREMQAGTFLGEAGVAARLADAVMGADQAFLELAKQIAA